MSPCAVPAPNAPVLFAELLGTSWPKCPGSREPVDEDNRLVAKQTEPRALSNAELAALADDFLERSEVLIDTVAPPPWEDEDDIFNGEVFGEESGEYEQLSSLNPTAEQKGNLARELMANEAARYPGCTGAFL